jgi:hypothetical protein
MIRHGNYYYLIVNRGLCCQGVNSTYYITAGRSLNVMGPFEDFRTILSSSGKYIGPGHFGLLREYCGNYVSVHYYDGNNNGAAKLDILKLTWVDGWPELTRDFSFSDCDPVGPGLMIKEDPAQGITLYPNPTTGMFSIEIADQNFADYMSITVFNLKGNQVFHDRLYGSTTAKINASLLKGIYFVQVENSENVFVKKIIIR